MKKEFYVAAALTISTVLSFTALAGSWKKDAKGWWYDYGNGSYPANKWEWIDGNGDGLAECYYFNSNGYMAASTYQDGYELNADGQWVNNGVVQRKNLGTVAGYTPTMQQDSSQTESVKGSTKTSKNKEKVSLLQFDMVAKDDMRVTSNCETTRGELFANCLEFYSGYNDCHVAYLVNGQYDTLSLTYAPEKGFDEKAKGSITVYGDDDVILWESDEINYKSHIETDTIDISGQDEIRISVPHTGGHGYVIIKDLYLE
ncbi:MAG: NPCBM/NEW2 domain-containing protein [Oribacterium sp.]|nr:NPCBM/NEW2 domain-containing protein [Oribacterium sp.]